MAKVVEAYTISEDQVKKQIITYSQSKEVVSDINQEMPWDFIKKQ